MRAIPLFIMSLLLIAETTSAASFYLMSVGDEASAGDEYLFMLDTEKEQLNAWDITLELAFNPARLETVQLFSAPSVISIQGPQISTSTIHFAGGIIGGVSGSIGLLKISVSNGTIPQFLVRNSLVLLHNGMGTEAPITEFVVSPDSLRLH